MKENVLQTRFIEGTNQQYSIREDGVVIRHYRYYYNNIKYEDRFIKSPIINCQGKNIRISPIPLVKKYFGKTCTICNCSSITNSFPKHRNVCYSCFNKKIPHYIKNEVKFKERREKDRKLMVERLTRAYVATSLKIPVNLLTDDLYQATKKRIQIKRKLKQLTLKQNG